MGKEKKDGSRRCRCKAVFGETKQSPIRCKSFFLLSMNVMASRSLKLFTVDDKKNKETTRTTTLAIASRISGLQDGTRLNSVGGDGRSPEDVLDKRRLKGKLIDARSPSVASLLPPPPARPARPLLPLELPSLSLDAIEVRF